MTNSEFKEYIAKIEQPLLREKFEKWVYKKYGTAELTRCYGDGYIGSASHQALSLHYASIQMLWEAWCASIEAQKEASNEQP